MISIVICSVDAAKFAAIERHYAGIMGDYPFEIVKVEGARSLCQGYNEGLDRSKGEIVAFSHDDLEFLGPDVRDRLLGHFKRFDVVGVAGTDRLAGPTWFAAGPPHIFGQILHKADSGYDLHLFGAPKPGVGSIQALDGLFVAFKREAIEKVRWDDRTFDGFHLYDLDCTFRAFRAGFKLGVACDLPVYHASSGHFGETWKRYADRFLMKHGPHLSRPCPYPWKYAMMRLQQKKEAAELTEPLYWKD